MCQIGRRNTSGALFFCARLSSAPRASAPSPPSGASQDSPLVGEPPDSPHVRSSLARYTSCTRQFLDRTSKKTYGGKIIRRTEVVNINDVLDSIRTRLRDFPQETRIREIYDRTFAAYQTDRAQGTKRELASDWTKLKGKFDAAIQQVKKETGLF
jgi:hypothetical protein